MSVRRYGAGLLAACPWPGGGSFTGRKKLLSGPVDCLYPPFASRQPAARRRVAGAAAKRFPEIEIVVCSGRLKPQPGDMLERATFIPKPFSVGVVYDHLRKKLPERKKPEPLKG